MHCQYESALFIKSLWELRQSLSMKQIESFIRLHMSKYITNTISILELFQCVCMKICCINTYLMTL